jgi:uncharacterized protein DUF4231
VSPTEQRQYLEHQLDQLIQRFKSDRDRHRRSGLLLRVLTVSLAGLVTILLGWKAPSGETTSILTNVALVLSVAITVVTAYEAFFDPSTLWVRETMVLSRLTDLRRDLAYAVAGGTDGEPDQAAVKDFKMRLDAILEDSLKAWLRLRGQDDPLTRTPDPRDATRAPSGDGPGRAPGTVA